MKRSNKNLMQRTARVYLNGLNVGKVHTLTDFLRLCHDAEQYLIDLLWQQGDSGRGFATLPVVHAARDRFGLTTRLGQCLAKHAKETIAAARELEGAKPVLRRHTVTLFYHFAVVEKFRGQGFNWCVRLTGSGAPRMTLPFKTNSVVEKFLADAWIFGKSVRIGRRDDRIFVDLLMQKPRPPLKDNGRIAGMDSNYKAGFVFSDGQVIGGNLYQRIQEFAKRQRNTHAEIKSMLGQELKTLDLSGIRMLCVEDLKKVRHNKRGTFPRGLNRRLTHWLYGTFLDMLQQDCEESGVRLEKKDPWKTSQFCRMCGRWDKRNRKGDKFQCVNCGHSQHADHNSAANLEFLGLAGKYGLRLLQSQMS